MPIFTNFNLGKEAKKYNEKQTALRKTFLSRVQSYIRAEKFAADDAQVAVDAFTKERDLAQLRAAEGEVLLEELGSES